MPLTAAAAVAASQQQVMNNHAGPIQQRTTDTPALPLPSPTSYMTPHLFHHAELE